MEGTTCPRCGMPAEAGIPRCPTCGATLPAAAPAGPPPSPDAPATGAAAVDMPGVPSGAPPGQEAADSPLSDPQPQIDEPAPLAPAVAVGGAAHESVEPPTPEPHSHPAQVPDAIGPDVRSASVPSVPAALAAPAQPGSPGTAVPIAPYPPYPGYPPGPAYPPPGAGLGSLAGAYNQPGTATPYVAPGYRYPGWNYATGAAPGAQPPWPAYPPPAVPAPQGGAGSAPGMAPALGAQAPAPPLSSPPQPGYPAYPQGYPPSAGGGPGGAPAYAYPYGYGMPWGYYPTYVPVLVRKRHPSDTYALVVSWIVTSAGGLSVLCGLLVSLILLVSLASGGTSDSLAADTSFFAFIAGPLVGGALALYYGIRGILRRPSPRFALPHPALFGVLTAVVFASALLLWHLDAAPGEGLLNVPLVVLSSALPALTILAFTAWRLRLPTSRRHVWMSLIYGSTLGALIALILNTIGEVVVVLFLLAQHQSSGGTAQDPLSTPQLTPEVILAAFLIVAVMAPLVEEGVKPLGAALIMRRLATPASAFLTGLASGVGFSIFESVSIYIGRGEADWVIIALERIGAGLLHGVGAGMGALGWYYFINGKGVRRRWLRGFGCLAYAVLQHAFFNGSALALAILPGDVGHWLAQPLYLGRLPLDRASLVFFLYYVAIAWVLVAVTGRLRRSTTKRELAPLPPAPLQPPAATPNVQPVGSAAQ